MTHIVRLRRRTIYMEWDLTIILDKLNCLVARWVYNERIFDQTRAVDQKGNAIVTASLQNNNMRGWWFVAADVYG